MFVLKDILGPIIAHFYWVSIRLSVVFQEFLAIDPQNFWKLSIDSCNCKSNRGTIPGCLSRRWTWKRSTGNKEHGLWGLEHSDRIYKEMFDCHGLTLSLILNPFQFPECLRRVFIFLENVGCAFLLEVYVCLLMTEPAGDAEVFAGGFDKVGGGK